VIWNCDARASLSLVIGATVGVTALGAIAAGLGRVLGRLTFEPTSPGLGGLTALIVVVASGLFLAAGILRLVRWRLERDAHSALVGAALMVMGGLCLPLGGFSRLFVSAEESSVIGTAIRCVATFVAIRLLVRALRTSEEAGRHRPERLLPRLFVAVPLAFLLLLAAEDLLPGVVSSGIWPPVLLSATLSLAWFALAVRVALESRTLPWARRAAPLFVGMALAEMLRGFDLGRVDTWTLSAVLLCAVMAGLATRSALLDLDGAVRADQHQRTDLSAALHLVTGKAHELTLWREQLTHDARNACAGLRAAMDILQRYGGEVEPEATESLRLAAVREIGHLEHLLLRPTTLPCERFEVSDVVRQVGDTARILGARVAVTAAQATGVGRPGDLAGVLRQLLANVQVHAAGSNVHIGVTSGESAVTITWSDDGPGLRDADADRVFERGYRGQASPGSGLGLYAARELMRNQGGDLVLGEPRPGATFLITLPVARDEVPGVPPVRIPMQPLTSPAPVLVELGS
jgi:signal transduction histidine kinase